MSKENISCFNFRLNLDNEQHMRVYKIFHNLNVDIHKSKNQFVVDALEFYIRSFEEDDLVKDAMTAKAKKQGWLSRDDFEDLKIEIKLEIRDELIHLLGQMVAGKQTADTHTELEVCSTNNRKLIDRNTNDEVVGMTDPDAISLISSWG
ncbi:MAG TPA: hypothetical protein VN258_06830 [Mobilitalea sp.]|nr:hypothetical protein [Mobilitalea sp.]